MMDKDDKLLDHEYDGIREHDNELPRWWLYLFYFTIVWGIIYLLYFHVLDFGYLSADEYYKEMNPAYVRAGEGDTKLLGVLPEYHSPYYNPSGDITPASAAQRQPAVAYIEETAAADTIVYTLLADQQSLDEGKAIFDKNCAQCHGKVGQGGIGPNLTDNYWIHGGSFTDIVKIIKYGFPSKGMIAWRGTLKPGQILQAASYIETIRGTNPSKAKAPQGELYSE
ncbi:MAG: cbb3-type cytochrome c oxidase N-terminal domain-containing protein [candidate division Zixibacteria bacterium]